MNATHADCIDCNQPAAQHNEATDDHEWRCVCGHTWRGHGDGDDKPTAADHALMTEDDFRHEQLDECPLCGDTTDDLVLHNEIAH